MYKEVEYTDLGIYKRVFTAGGKLIHEKFIAKKMKRKLKKLDKFVKKAVKKGYAKPEQIDELIDELRRRGLM